MKQYILDDLYRYVGNDCNKLNNQLRYFFFTPGFRWQYFFRHASNAKNKFTKLFWHIMLRHAMKRTGIQIPLGTRIGRGMKIGHWGTIVINPGTIIGNNFNIAQGCLIGNSQGKHAGIPTIADNVVMGANSIIVGGVHIGNNVLIAPGSFVNFDVPDDSIVIGNPGKIISSNSPSAKYIVYPLKIN